MRYFFSIIIFLLSFKIAYCDENLESFINKNSAFIIKSSSKTVNNILKKIDKYDENHLIKFLELWKSKKLYYLKKSKKIVLANKTEKNNYEVLKIFSNIKIGIYKKNEIKKIKPNSGVRAKISSALVKFQIFSRDKKKRLNSIDSLKKNILQEHLVLLRKASLSEKNKNLKIKIDRLLEFAILQYSLSENEKLQVLKKLSSDNSIETRAALAKILKTSKILVTNDLRKLKNSNVSRIIIPDLTVVNDFGESLSKSFFNNNIELNITKAYDLAEKNGYVKKRVTIEDINKVIQTNIKKNEFEGVNIKEFNNLKKRIDAYNIFADKNKLIPYLDNTLLKESLKPLHYYSLYDEKSKRVTDQAKEVLSSIKQEVKLFKYLDLFIDGLSLASIYFLGAIGLAITFGVMRVINMAHGEFIMMGAYTGYVVQLYISNHTLSLIVALPLAFLITFCAGVIMERLVIRHLYKNPLDTLLATFGISIALQQLAKNIFGTQARPLTSPNWLDGALTVNDDLSISYIRIAIFILSIIFFLLLLFIMNKTRFGLETRSVTQNPIMASSMGVNTDKINMLTFGFGSGIAGIAGVAIGLFSKVTSELGSEYIVQSFMTVVVGGVGNIWGTLAGASLIGFLQKIIEWFNPSNTLAAQTYMIIFIILFIQFRPRGLIALKGRASNDV